MTSALGFLRSSMTFNDYVSIEELSFFSRLKRIGVAEQRDSIVFSEPEGWEEFDPANYAPNSLPAWVNFFEVLRIGDNVAALPFEDRDPTDTSLGNSLVGALEYSGGVEVPTFGRRMIVVSFGDERSNRDIVRSDEKLRRAVGHTATGVWHGLDIVAYCFVDNRSVQSICEALEPAADKHVSDFIVVEPLEVILPDKTNISPLQNWLSSGFRSGKGRTR